MTTEQDPLTFAIIGAAMTVHRTLGHDFLEAVYQDALVLINFGVPSLDYKRLILPLRKSAQSVDEDNNPQISQMDADSRKGDLR